MSAAQEMQLTALHALATEQELDEGKMEAAMASGAPTAALVQLLMDARAQAPSSEASRIAAALADGSAEEREAAYGTIEGAMKEQNVGRLIAGVKPLMESVLCAPASRVGGAEYTRTALLLCVNNPAALRAGQY